MRALLAGGNPALLEAVQRGLARMVGSSSGYIESLPAVVRTRISYLEELQVEFEDLEDKFDDELKELEAKYRALYGKKQINTFSPFATAFLLKYVLNQFCSPSVGEASWRRRW